MKLILLSIPVLYSIGRSLSWVCKYMFSLSNNFRVWESLQGKFAVVLNATTVEGEAICERVVEKGMKLRLIGDNEDKLIELRIRLKKRTQILYHIVDFTTCSDFSFLEKYDVGLLINNIIPMESNPKFFIDQRVGNVIETLFSGQMQLIKTVVTGMSEKHRGYVINIGYGNTIQPNPSYSLTSAIISAYKSWSECMYYEMMPFNVNIEFMDAGTICHPDSKTKKHGFFTPLPETFAKSVMNSFGSSYFTIPYWPHMIVYILLFLTPAFIVARMRGARNEVINRSYHNVS